MTTTHRRAASALPLALALALATAPRAAAEPAAAPADAPAGPAPPDAVGETIVTGLRLPRPLREVPATITVISRAELERSPKRTADDLVRTVPSVATFRRSTSLVADPTSQGVNLRGLGPSGVSRALVLHDGVPLNDPFGGWIYWRAIPLLALDRIEVAPGGASARFGNFALGGVIQLHGRRIDRRAVEAVVSTGSLATHRAAARATERRGGLGVELDADVLDSAGYAPIAPEARGAVDGRAPSTHLAAGARVELTRGASRWRLRGRVFDEALDAGTRHTTADVRTVTVAGGWVHARAAGALELSAFAGDQRFDQVRARVTEDRDDAAVATRQRVPSTSQGVAASWTTRPLRGAGAHVVTVGVDALRVEGTSIEALSPAAPMPGSLIERAAGGEQRFAGAYVTDELALPGGLEVHAAARIDAWQDLAGERRLVRAGGDEQITAFPRRRDVRFSPRLGVLQRAGERLAVRASGYRAFRAPTLNELYRPFQVGTVLTDANAELDAEVAWGGELGPEVVLGTFVARATGFWNELDRPIQNVTLAEPAPSGATRQRQNLGHARVRGVEVEASWRPSRRWVATAGYTFVDAIVTEAPAAPELVGKRLAQDPRHRATATASFEDAAFALVTAQVRWLGRQYEDDRNTLPMDGVVVLDAIVARDVGRGLRVFVAVENLLDARYLVGRAGVDTIGPPRMLQAGLHYTTPE